jgi:hypothetical protein
VILIACAACRSVVGRWASINVGVRRAEAGDEVIQRAANGEAASIQDVGINHGRFDVFVPEQLLHGADIVTTLQQMGGKGVTEGVTGDTFFDIGGEGSFPDGLLKTTGTQVMAADYALTPGPSPRGRGDGTRVDGQIPGGENVLPNPFPIGIGMFFRVYADLRGKNWTGGQLELKCAAN